MIYFIGEATLMRVTPDDFLSDPFDEFLLYDNDDLLTIDSSYSWLYLMTLDGMAAYKE